MISMDQLKTGLTVFVSDKMAPAIAQPAKRFAMACAAELMIENIDKHPVVAHLGVVDDGQVDIDKLYRVMRKNAKEPIQIKIPVIGEFRFNQADIDTLFTTIMEV